LTVVQLIILEMGTVGIFGSFLFGKLVGRWQTFYQVTRSEAGRFEDHAVWLNKPRSEYGGPQLIELELKMVLDANSCGDPRPIIAQLQTYERNGLAGTLILGGKAMGPRASMFSLRTLIAKETKWHRDGMPLRVELDVDFTEYEPIINRGRF
jgi:phage protein U